MEPFEAVVTLVLGIVVIFIAPALVWSAIMAELVQLIRDSVRERRAGLAERPAERDGGLWAIRVSQNAEEGKIGPP